MVGNAQEQSGVHGDQQGMKKKIMISATGFLKE
jgi:hypothetical protein